MNESRTTPYRPPHGLWHGFDSLASSHTRMAAFGAGAGSGLRHLHSALASVFDTRRRWQRLVEMDARTAEPALARSRTDCQLLLFHLGRSHPAGALSRSAPPAPCLRSGAVVHRCRRVLSAGG